MENLVHGKDAGYKTLFIRIFHSHFHCIPHIFYAALQRKPPISSLRGISLGKPHGQQIIYLVDRVYVSVLPEHDHVVDGNCLMSFKPFRDCPVHIRNQPF